MLTIAMLYSLDSGDGGFAGGLVAILLDLTMGFSDEFRVRVQSIKLIELISLLVGLLPIWIDLKSCMIYCSVI